MPEWTALLADCYRFEPFVLAACDTDGELLAGIPTLAVRLPAARTRWVSLPFSDTCALLARQDVSVEDVVAALREQVRVHGCRELEIRSALPPADDAYPVEVGYHHVVELPRDPADLRVHRNYRQHRNQAARKGVKVSRGGAGGMAAFYRLHTLTRRRLGVPVQSRRFFDLLQKRILAPGHGFVATAALDGEVLAAAVYLAHGVTIVAKYQASDPDRRETGAGHLMHWEVMCAACDEGYRFYDLGRTDPDNEGLAAFKRRMGAVETPLVYTHIGRRPSSRSSPGVRDLSRRVIRSSPPWVCRALGEVLYRWTA